MMVIFILFAAYVAAVGMRIFFNIFGIIKEKLGLDCEEAEYENEVEDEEGWVPTSLFDACRRGDLMSVKVATCLVPYHPPLSPLSYQQIHTTHPNSDGCNLILALIHPNPTPPNLYSTPPPVVPGAGLGPQQHPRCQRRHSPHRRCRPGPFGGDDTTHTLLFHQHTPSLS